MLSRVKRNLYPKVFEGETIYLASVTTAYTSTVEPTHGLITYSRSMYIPSGCRTLVSVKVLESFSVLSFVLTKFPSQILTIWRVSRGTYYNSTTRRSGHSRTENLGTIDFHVTQGYFMGGQNKFIRIYLSSLDQFGRSKQIHTNLFIIPRPIFLVHSLTREVPK